ncbi:response regulator [Edaphobacter albus]|uniref:response regulator n=1 Tax=Edaphobacter sp. 4G125 TaxID=2763071 RepID=UPI00164918B3|nr:response regulator [Edaphobacter sp. 4G125]QNI37485.1 response regulator [Edaphobacter sp. 4G125]
MKRRILLVDDEVAVLLTLKAVLEINGFDVDTAASGREGKLKLRANEYHMVISDMRMESEKAGAAVIEAARSASYRPAVALLTAFPLAEEDWQELGADRMLVKPMQTRLLLEQIDRLMEAHATQSNGSIASVAGAAQQSSGSDTSRAAKKTGAKRASASESKQAPSKKSAQNVKAEKKAAVRGGRRG